MSDDNQAAESTSQQTTSLPLPTNKRIELSESRSSISLAPVGSHDTDPFVAQDLPLSPAPNTQPVVQPAQAAPLGNTASGQTNSAETQSTEG